MKQVALYLILMTGLLACGEEQYYPPGLRGYQVEQLLTGGEKKHWFVTSSSIDGQRLSVDNCADSIWWVFESFERDSIASYQLRLDGNCLLYDTTFVGALTASGDKEIFHDTIYFERSNGTVRFALIERITSEFLRFNYLEGGNDFDLNLEASPSRLLPKQVSVLLAGTGAKGTYQDWKLTSLRRNGSNVNIRDCEDTTVFRFGVNDALFGLNEYQRDTLCNTISGSTFFGNAQEIGNDNGFFNNQVYFSGGIIDELRLNSLSANEFSASYDTITVSYRLMIP